MKKNLTKQHTNKGVQKRAYIHQMSQPWKTEGARERGRGGGGERRERGRLMNRKSQLTCVPSDPISLSQPLSPSHLQTTHGVPNSSAYSSLYPLCPHLRKKKEAKDGRKRKKRYKEKQRKIVV